MFDSFDYGWLNVGSLILGLVAWFIPVVSIVRYKKRKTKFPFVLPLLSMGPVLAPYGFKFPLTIT